MIKIISKIIHCPAELVWGFITDAGRAITEGNALWLEDADNALAQQQEEQDHVQPTEHTDRL